MKKKIAIMLTLILATGTFTACRLEEKMNNDIKTSVVSTTADVSVSETFSEISTTMQAEISTVSAETTQSKTEPIEKIKSDSGQDQTKIRQNLDADSIAEPKEENVKHTIANSKTSSIAQQKKGENKSEKVTEKPAQKPKQKPSEKSKPAQPPTEKKNVDVSSVVSACIAYGKQLGMKYDSTLNTSNASWFSPTNASYYDDTQSLTSDCYSDVEYVAYYYKNDGIKPSDLSFNVVAENNKIYVVYC